MEAAARLAESGDPQATGALQQALRDPTAEVAREAALAIAKGRRLSAVEALSEVVENPDGYFHPSVRIAAAESLGQLNDPRSVAPLCRAVRDPLAEPSRAAIRALGLVAREAAVPVLVSVINNVEGFFLPSVRVAAVEVLATITSSTAKDCLRDLLSNPDEDPEVRQAAALIFA
jgi:HEAT repeat protein